MFQIVSGFAPLLKTEEETPKEEGLDKCARQTRSVISLSSRVFLFLVQKLQPPRRIVLAERWGKKGVDRFLRGNRFELFILINTVRAPGI